jgi:hypothetical protein
MKVKNDLTHLNSPHLKTLKSTALLLGAGVIAFFTSPVFAGEPIPATGSKSDYSDLTGNMPPPEYYDDVPTKATAARMLDQLAYQRAVQIFVKTVPGKGWFFLFRLYGPEEAYFDGKWQPDDIDKVN